MCPSKLDSNFEISHAASGFLAKTLTTLCRSFDLPTARRSDAPDFAVKITFVFGIRIYLQDRVRMARLSYIICCSQKKYFSMWMSKSGRIVSLSRTVACKVSPVGVAFVWRFRRVVGLIGLEPMTPALSRRCSNQLSYRPVGVPSARNLKFQI